MNDLKKYRNYQEKLKNYRYACNIISFDEETICPKKDKENSLSICDYFYKEIIKISESDQYYDLLKRLSVATEGQTEVEQMAIKKELEMLEKERLVPKDLKFEGIDIYSKAALEWELARDSMDYSKFDKCFSEVVEYNKKIIACKEGKYKGYNVLLDDMEDDFTITMYDDFFNKLESEILPLLKQVLKQPKRYNESIKEVRFDIDKQKKLTKKICDLMGYTNEVGYIGETIHPFTNGFNSNDVRTTTNYKEDMLFSNLLSVMHEVGHALYELDVDKKYSDTVLAGGASCALHESQSRFYENYLGRSREFIEFLYPILKEVFPEELKPYTLDDVYYYLNDVYSQPLRTEADELTYPFHVLVRYKIEKMLFDGSITPEEVDKTFNDLLEEYIGYRPKDKKEGCFQDIHWTSGFGYFPTYAIGSAISAQVYHYMNKDIDIASEMKKGEFKNITEWLKEHIHKYGSSKKNFEVIRLAFGEDFNPQYYIDYLKDKFTKIYNL